MSSIKIKKRYLILIGIVVLLIVIRIILPYVVLKYANKKVSTMNRYYGHINDIDLSLLRGAYIIKDMYLDKVDEVSKKQTPFFKAPNIDLSVEWKPLFHGSLVGKMVFDSPVVIFTKDRVEIGDLKRDTSDFRKLLKDLMPLKVNRFEVNKGSIHYVDNGSKPKVDISLKQTHILALNLTNATNNKVELPSDVTAEASVYDGTMNFNMKLNPMAVHTTFDLNAEVKNINLILLNDFLRAYGNFDVNKGSLGLYIEMATKDGKFKGYVKPIIKDLDVVGPEDRNDSFFQKVWESLISVAGVILKNQRKDQIGTKIRMEGNYNDPSTNTLDALWEVLRNAFIQALVPSVDNLININSVKAEKPEESKNLLQKIFSPANKDDKKKSK